MDSKIETGLIKLDDDSLNDLAAEWYFLALHFNACSLSAANAPANELIWRGLMLKRYLKELLKI